MMSRTGLGTPSLDGVRPTSSPQAWEALRSPEGSTRGSRAEVLARSDGGGGSGHVPLATPASAPTMSRGAVNKRPFHEVSPSIRMLPASTKSMCFLVDSESDSEGEGVTWVEDGTWAGMGFVSLQPLHLKICLADVGPRCTRSPGPQTHSSTTPSLVIQVILRDLFFVQRHHRPVRGSQAWSGLPPLWSSPNLAFIRATRTPCPPCWTAARTAVSHKALCLTMQLNLSLRCRPWWQPCPLRSLLPWPASPACSLRTRPPSRPRRSVQ